MSNIVNYPDNPGVGKQVVIGTTTKQWDGEKWVNVNNGNHEQRLRDEEGVTRALLKTQGLSGNHGFFDIGFTYLTAKDAGITPDGGIWLLGTGSSTVAAGTVPSAPEYTKLMMNSAGHITTSDERSVQQRLDALPAELEQKGTAAQLLGVHNASAGAHPQLSAFVTSEANRAQAAADQASSAEKTYDTVAAGEAAEVDGSYFWVVSSLVSEVLELWRMGVTTATDTGKRTISAKGVEDVAKEIVDAGADDLFRYNREDKFPAANLAVRRFTAADTSNDYPAGYSQTATAGGLQVEIPSQGSGFITHFLRTGKWISEGQVLECEYIHKGNLSTGHLVIGYIDTAGDYKYYYLSNSGNFIKSRNYGQEGEVLVTGLTTYGYEDTVSYSVDYNKLVVQVNGVLVYEYALGETEFRGQVVAGQQGFADYSFLIRLQADSIRAYVDDKVAELGGGVEDSVSQAELNSQAGNLFRVSETEEYQEASLPVRRYTSPTAFNDYLAGTYQTAVSGGLRIDIPSVGSGLITHFLRTGKRITTASVKHSFRIISENVNNTVFCIGWIDAAGDHIVYSYGYSGVARRFKNYGGNQSTDLSGIVQPLQLNDVLELEVTDGKVVFWINGSAVLAVAQQAGDFDGELIIGQAGFNGGHVVSTKTESDPIRNYVDARVPLGDMYFELVAGERIRVHTKSAGDKWVSYSLRRVVNSSMKLDAWGVGNHDESQLVSGSFVSSGRFPDKLSGTGSMEGPWKEVGGAIDFISGSAHGDELTDSTFLLVDGKQYNPLVDNVLVQCSKVTFETVTTLYSVVSPGVTLAKRKRVYEFDKSGYDMEMVNTFIQDVTFTLLYHNSFSSATSAFDKLYLDRDFTVQPLDGTEHNIQREVKQYTVFSDKASMQVTLLDVDAGDTWPRLLVAETNKVYFDLTNGPGSAVKTGRAGESWSIKSRYQLATYV